MKLLKATVILAAASLVGTLGLAGNAHAGAYALSYNNFSNGIIDLFQSDDNGTCSLIGSGIGGVATCGLGTVISNTANAPLNTSASQAALLGAADVSNTAGPALGIVDALPSNQGAAIGTPDNTYTALGVLGSNYSRGDSELVSEQAIALNPGLGPIFIVTSTIDAINIAETALVSNSSSAAAGNLDSGTLTEISLTLAQPGQIGISFDADPFIDIFLNPDSLPGSLARAGLTASVTITDQLGGVIFSWAPDGLGGGIVGGVSLLDLASLNLTPELQVPGAVTYDPTGDGIGGSSLSYAALTNAIPTGDYTLTIAVGEFVRAAKQVPEPGSLVLVALGLLGLGAGTRWHRKKEARGQPA